MRHDYIIIVYHTVGEQIEACILRMPSATETAATNIIVRQSYDTEKIRVTLGNDVL